MRPKLLLNLCAGDIASGWWGKMAGGKESENERQRVGRGMYARREEEGLRGDELILGI